MHCSFTQEFEDHLMQVNEYGKPTSAEQAALSGVGSPMWAVGKMGEERHASACVAVLVPSGQTVVIRAENVKLNGSRVHLHSLGSVAMSATQGDWLWLDVRCPQRIR